MKQDRTGIVAAVFNIRFVGNFAMGLELYRYIVGCKSLTPTQSIVAELEAAYMLNYEDVVCEYLSCLGTDRNVPASTNREQPPTAIPETQGQFGDKDGFCGSFITACMIQQALAQDFIAKEPTLQRKIEETGPRGSIVKMDWSYKPTKRIKTWRASDP